MNTRTPRKITPTVQEFCREVVTDGEPIYLEVTPSGREIPLDCFTNVEKQIARHGGTPQYGWRIWEWPYTMIEAEFHAVWRTPDGALVDITPAPMGITTILFLPDSTRAYEGRQVNSVRKSLTKSELMDEFIQLSDEQFEILNKGERANMNSDLSMSGKDALDFHKALAFTRKEEQRMGTIMNRLSQILRLLSPCPCGSFRRFSACCGKSFV